MCKIKETPEMPFIGILKGDTNWTKGEASQLQIWLKLEASFELCHVHNKHATEMIKYG